MKKLKKGMRQDFYVYCLLDPRTNQVFYVGKGVNNRIYEHYRVRNRLTNPILKNKLISLANNNLKPTYHKVLENVEELTAFQKEIDLIQLYGKKVDKTGILCNLSDGGEGNSAAWTDERKKLKSDKMKGNRGALPIINKAVNQYSLQGEFIQTFPSAKVASTQIEKANHSYITQCCKKKQRSAGGFLWTYVGQEPTLYTKTYYRKVSQYKLDGSFVATYISLTDAQQKTKIELHNISECCRGNSKTAGGYIWEYME